MFLLESSPTLARCLLVLAVGPALGAQATLSAQTAARDSQRVLAAARASQERFERRRRDYLPWSDRSSSQPCDEIIGRFCFTFGDDDGDWTPPPEAREVGPLRDALVADLGRAALQLPADEWIAGQHVRYLVEARKPEEARAAAAECRPANGWWCAALVGYAAHAAEDYAAADSTYARALLAMPADQRCRWTDISLLLEGAARRSYDRLDCAARDSIEARFWSLAHPLMLIPGNDRRTEHFSRLVQDRLQDRAFPIFGVPWLADSRQVLLRFGWPTSFARQRSYSLDPAAGVDIVAQYSGQGFDPTTDLLDSPGRAVGVDRWLPRGRRRASYAPAYARTFDTLPHQAADFQDGDSVVVVGAYDLSRDSLQADAPARAGLFLTTGTDRAPLGVRSDQRAAGVLALRAPPEPGLMSLEVLSTSQRRAGRARQWLALTPRGAGQVALSDLLLLSRADSLPRTLEAAIPLARTSTTVRTGEATGLYWEVYGLGPGPTPFAVSLTLVKEGRGWLRRAAKALGLGGGADRPHVSLAWDDAYRPGTATTSGALALDLSGNSPGAYLLRLQVTPRAGPPVAVERRIRVVAPT